MSVQEKTMKLNKRAGAIAENIQLIYAFLLIVVIAFITLGISGAFYTYDINLSGADSRFTNLAAHEVTFLYNMEYNRKSKKKGAIKCPKI